MDFDKEYNDSITKDFGYKYAAFWRRLLSAIIDLIIIYSVFFFIKFISIPSLTTEIALSFNKYIYAITFIDSIIILFIFYVKFGRTIGDYCLKIKPIFEGNVKNKNFELFKRAVFKSAIFVPSGGALASLICVIILIVFSILLFISPNYRKKKILAWDFGSRMVVVEDSCLETTKPEL